ncbi:carbohydrate ABC transporter permease [Aquipuribacter sp. SD81]|uniref:carbohydrate ABC transporter permease n=1 Tax=Aquipuribacter sp. SD81 TaxID=3127703 RepID=UPI003FA58AB8
MRVEQKGEAGGGPPGPSSQRTRQAVEQARAQASDRVKAERRLGWMLAGPAFLVMLSVTLYPILQATYDSLFDYRLTDPDNRAFIGLRNYGVILTDPVWWRAFGVTSLITVITVVVELVLGFALAMVMHKVLTNLRGVVRAAILIPYAIITVVSAFAWQFAFANDTGFVNTWFRLGQLDWFGDFWTALAVICASEIWKTTPFISLLLLAGLAQVPEDMQEAAKVDGATWWERFRRVTAPSMKASIMVAVLFRALDAFRVFDNIFIMTNGAQGTESLSILAYRQTISRVEIGLGSAVSVLLFLSVVLIAVGFVKAFKVDLAAGRDG